MERVKGYENVVINVIKEENVMFYKNICDSSRF
jgi:hypothetical protein